MASHYRERRRCLEVLGLSVSASDEEIKRSYKALALQYHPDKNKSEGATEKFQEIQGAYKYLREGPGILQQHDEDSDDEGIPLIILIRLFPWLFPEFAAPPPSRRVFDPFGYDSSDDDEGIFFFPHFSDVHHFRRYSAGPFFAGGGASSFRPGAPGPSSRPFSHQGAEAAASADRVGGKRERKKRAKLRKKAEKAAATPAPSNEHSGDNFPTKSASNWGRREASSGKEKASNQGPPEAASASEKKENQSTPSAKVKKGEGEKAKSDREKGKTDGEKEKNDGEKRKTDGEKEKTDEQNGKNDREQGKSDVEKGRSERDTGKGKGTSESPEVEAQPAARQKKTKQQLKEEQRRREEEKAQIAKDLEEKMRLEREKKARKQAARDERERQEAEERQRQEEQEIAEQARRLQEEQRRKDEEAARRKQEEEDRKEMARLMEAFDDDLFLDASGDFVTKDTSGIGSIKIQPIKYNSSGYGSVIEGEMNTFAEDYSDYSGYGGRARRYQGGRRGGRSRGGPRGRGGFHPPPQYSGPEPNGPLNPGSDQGFEDSGPPQQPFGNSKYRGGPRGFGPPRGRGGQGYQGDSGYKGHGFEDDRVHGGQGRQGGRGRGGQRFQGDRGLEEEGFQGNGGREGERFQGYREQGDQGFQGDRGHGGERFQGDRERGSQGFPGDRQSFNSGSRDQHEGSQHPLHSGQDRFNGQSRGDPMLHQSANQSRPPMTTNSYHQGNVFGSDAAKQFLSQVNNRFDHKQAPFQGNPLHSQSQFGRSTNPHQPPLPPSSNPPVQHSPSPPRPLHAPGFHMGGNVAGNPGPFSSPPPLVPPPGFHHLAGVSGQRGPRPQSAHQPAAPPPPPANFGHTSSGQPQRPPVPSTTGFNAPPAADLNRLSGPQFSAQPRFTSPPKPSASFMMGYGASGVGRQRPYIPPFGSPAGNIQLNNVRSLPPRPDLGTAPSRVGANFLDPPAQNVGGKPPSKGEGFCPKLESEVSSGSGAFYGLDDIDD